MATIDMKTLKFENDENTYKVVDGDAVHISAQTLSDIEKTQVLNNIGAAAAGHSHTLSSLGAAAASHTHEYSFIELNQSGQLEGYGGFIDFHYNGSTSDYTSRILERSENILSINEETGKAIKTNAIQGNAIIYSTTQPTGNIQGQLWLKPI